jgi:hypothetical protein
MLTQAIESLQPTETYDGDCAVGRAQADAVISMARDETNPLLVTCAIREVLASGRWSGIEIGFMSQISKAVIQGSR